MHEFKGIAIGAALALALGGALVLAGCSRGGSSRTVPVEAAAPGGGHSATVTKTFEVSGMMCTGCEAAIKGGVKRLPGVKRADASTKRGEATVAYDPKKVSETEIEKSIEKAGYHVTGEATAPGDTATKPTTKERP